MYASRGGSPHRLTQHEARIVGRAAPKDLVNIWHSQQSTDSKMAPAHGSEQDFRCQAQVRAQYQRHRFEQASNNCRVLGNALTRVNIANRYLGNKACEYETTVCNTGCNKAVEALQAPRKTQRACKLAYNSNLVAQKESRRQQQLNWGFGQLDSKNPTCPPHIV